MPRPVRRARPPSGPGYYYYCPWPEEKRSPSKQLQVSTSSQLPDGIFEVERVISVKKKVSCSLGCSSTQYRWGLDHIVYSVKRGLDSVYHWCASVCVCVCVSKSHL